MTRCAMPLSVRSPLGTQATTVMPRLSMMRSRLVRFVMGKPYRGETLEQVGNAKKKEGEDEQNESSTPPKKFTKAFQAYLDSVAEDLKKTAEEKQPAKKLEAGAHTSHGCLTAHTHCTRTLAAAPPQYFAAGQQAERRAPETCASET